jgi:hypothetical protein
MSLQVEVKRNRCGEYEVEILTYFLTYFLTCFFNLHQIAIASHRHYYLRSLPQW